jgi:hypothetical protein
MTTMLQDCPPKEVKPRLSQQAKPVLARQKFDWLSFRGTRLQKKALFLKETRPASERTGPIFEVWIWRRRDEKKNNPEPDRDKQTVGFTFM